MYIISKKTAIIIKPHFAANGWSSYEGEQCRIEVSTRPQLVPDWVRDTVHFTLAAKDGSMTEVTPEVAAAINQAIPEPIKPTGWDAKSGVTPVTGLEQR